MPEVQGNFVQAESELGAANMVFGAAACGELACTTSSGPGMSLMSEAISYIAGAQVPAVFVNIVRAGPGLGGILPSQSDYFQATKGGGHGDYRLLVLAPASVQEAVDLTMLGFQLAGKYRNPVMILGDGMIGQMMEPVEFKPLPTIDGLPSKETWATSGAKDRKSNIVRSLFLDPETLENNNRVLAAKYAQWQKDEIRYTTFNLDNNPKMLVVAYGTMARICSTAITELKAEGIEVGLLRPITLFPFPSAAIAEHGKKIGRVMSIEMSMGQMVEDVQAAVGHDIKVDFFGRAGGIVPSPDEVAAAIKASLKD